MISASQKREFVELGYVIVDGIEPDLMAPLKVACDRAIAAGRSGAYKNVRTKPPGNWGINNMFHPDIFDPVYLDYMGSELCVKPAEALLGTSQLRLRTLELLHSFEVCDEDTPDPWHRDGLASTISERELTKVLEEYHGTGLQWNAALCDDQCLFFVPGTHLRVSTPEEVDVLLNHPLDPMPGEVHVELAAGQAVYYNPRGLHRGIYSAVPRVTLHGTFRTLERPQDELGDLEGVYYKECRFMDEPWFRDAVHASSRAETLIPLYENWLVYAQICQQRGL